VSGRIYRSTPEKRKAAKDRRDDLRAKKQCINGPKHPAPAEGATKCWLCLETQRGDRMPNRARRAA
jgi:hypothetical protein